MKLWEYVWFQKVITWCRKWKWFDKYIYGMSLNLEDFCRNPAEVLRDTYPPFIFKDVKPYSILNLRIGYIPESEAEGEPNCWSVPMGKHGIIVQPGKWVWFDLRMFNPWWTKFCNSAFFFQFAVSFKYYIIPIPYVSMNIRLGYYKYFQFGIGWGAENHLVSGRGDAVLCGKLRYVNQKTSSENTWNPSDVVGFFEGSV